MFTALNESFEKKLNYGLKVNPGKSHLVNWDNKAYYCYAIKTKVITDHHKLEDVIHEYASPVIDKGDVLFISEKMLACSQGRAIPLSFIKPGAMANFLSKFVTKTNAGIGLSMPETMQCAIDECGAVRILCASAISVIGKILGRKGWFYKIAGRRAACIDGPCDYTIPPYNKYVVLAPRYASKIACQVSEMLGGITVLIVDINDLGAEILGSSQKIDKKKYLGLLQQNPLGQSGESTPMGILRPIK